jgi:hypothetical protein
VSAWLVTGSCADVPLHPLFSKNNKKSFDKILADCHFIKRKLSILEKL